MNQKIIATDSQYPDVLLYLDENEDLDQIVIIQAVGQTEEDLTDEIVNDIIVFPDRESCRRFIRDYSLESANEFCETNGIYFPGEYPSKSPLVSAIEASENVVPKKPEFPKDKQS